MMRWVDGPRDCPLGYCEGERNDGHVHTRTRQGTQGPPLPANTLSVVTFGLRGGAADNKLTSLADGHHSTSQCQMRPRLCAGWLAGWVGVEGWDGWIALMKSMSGDQLTQSYPRVPRVPRSCSSGCQAADGCSVAANCQPVMEVEIKGPAPHDLTSSMYLQLRMYIVPAHQLQR